MTNAAAQTANDKAYDALSYVTANGEADPNRPTSEDIRQAVADYDGSCQSEGLIWSVYQDAYKALEQA